MPSRVSGKCSEELTTNDGHVNEDLRDNNSTSRPLNVLEIASTTPFMDMTETQAFQDKLIDLCDKVLITQQATESQRVQFIDMIKMIVFDTLYNT